MRSGPNYQTRDPGYYHPPAPQRNFDTYYAPPETSTQVRGPVPPPRHIPQAPPPPVASTGFGDRYAEYEQFKRFVDAQLYEWFTGQPSAAVASAELALMLEEYTERQEEEAVDPYSYANPIRPAPPVPARHRVDTNSPDDRHQNTAPEEQMPPPLYPIRPTRQDSSKGRSPARLRGSKRPQMTPETTSGSPTSPSDQPSPVAPSTPPPTQTTSSEAQQHRSVSPSQQSKPKTLDEVNEANRRTMEMMAGAAEDIRRAVTPPPTRPTETTPKNVQASPAEETQTTTGGEAKEILKFTTKSANDSRTLSVLLHHNEHLPFISCKGVFLVTETAGMKENFAIMTHYFLDGVPNIYTVDIGSATVCALHDTLNDSAVTGLQRKFEEQEKIERMLAGYVKLMAYGCNKDVHEVVYAIVEKLKWSPTTRRREYTTLCDKATHWGFVSLDASPTVTLSVGTGDWVLEEGCVLSFPNIEDYAGWDLEVRGDISQEIVSYMIFLGFE